MSKKIIQDVIVGKKSIRQINKSSSEKNHIVSDGKHIEHKKSVNAHTVEKISSGSHIFLWLLGITLVVVIIFFISLKFSTATILITPKKVTVDMNNTYDISSDTSSKNLKFEVMTIKNSESKTLEADSEEYVERKAIGKAIIYNNFSEQTQRLINNTRLESSDGRIYRIRQSVDVPGIKTVNGTKTPGSVDVEIIADEAGDKYNMKVADLKGDFTIPGLKGSPRYTAFYARLSSDLIGGMIGKAKKISEQKLETAKKEIEESLKVKLLRDAYSKVPSGYFIPKGMYYFDFNDLSTDSSTVSGYEVKIEGSIYSIVFNKKVFSQFIAKNKIKDFADEDVEAFIKDDMNMSVSGDSEKPWLEKTLKVKFDGRIDIVWLYDRDKIINYVAGKDKSIISRVFEENKTSIIEINSTITPRWKSNFPDNVKKITIKDSVLDSLSE